MKTGKEIHVKLNKNFKTYYGTTNNKELKTIYVGISTWITPVAELENYSSYISQLRVLIKNLIYQNINHQLFKNEYIVDIDVKCPRIEFNKSSYLNIEITLFLKDKDISILSGVIKNDMTRFINNIVTMEQCNNFQFAMSKKQYATAA